MAVPEEGSAAAFDLIGREELLAPTLLLSEVGNALWKKVRRNQVDAAVSFDEELANLSSLLVLREEGWIIGRALAMARALDHPVYDCVYLSLAEAESTKVVTADRRFLRAVRKSAWKALVEELA